MTNIRGECNQSDEEDNLFTVITAKLIHSYSYIACGFV